MATTKRLVQTAGLAAGVIGVVAVSLPRVHVMVDDHVAIVHGEVPNERDACVTVLPPELRELWGDRTGTLTRDGNSPR